MVALNPDFVLSQAEADKHEARQRVDGEPKASPKDGLKRVPEIGQFEPQNRVGRFFSLAADCVGVDRCSSRNCIGENRGYAYETASVDTEYEYSPFGEVIRSFGSYADANAFRFSTKYWDEETEFYYYGYRHYDSATGRWLSKDPIEEQGGLNLYAFVGNRAINFVDYDGRIWNAISAKIGAVAGGVSGAVSGALGGARSGNGIVGGITGAVTGGATGFVAGGLAGASGNPILGLTAGGAAGGAAGPYCWSICWEYS